MKTPQGLSMKNLIITICGSYVVGKQHANSYRLKSTIMTFVDRDCQPLKYQEVTVLVSTLPTNLIGVLYEKIKRTFFNNGKSCQIQTLLGFVSNL
jgi:hypothetical protein